MVLLGPWSLDRRQGLLCLIAKVEPYDLGTGTPNFRVPRLGPRAFSVSGVNSSRGSFVWQLHLYSRLNFKRNRATALTEWRQLLSA
jgi:hypothetical protein